MLPEARSVSEGVDLGVARGGSPETVTKAAVDILGGMDRFVGKGDVVVLKPNVCWRRPPKFAVNTNPQVVRTVAELCYQAGARKVRIVEYSRRDPEGAFEWGGINAAVEDLDVEISTIYDLGRDDWVEAGIPGWTCLRRVDIARPVVESDVLIDLPIAKRHVSTRITLGMKNLMGCIRDRQSFHRSDLHRCIAELTMILRPDLIVVDAVRISMRGSEAATLEDVRKLDTVVAGTDPVAVDAYGATLLGCTPEEIGYIRIGDEMGIGEADLGKLRLRERDVSREAGPDREER